MNQLKTEPFEDINVNGARIRLVGTAHVSQASTDFVIEQIEKGSYDCVAVELCASRCQRLIDPQAVENMNLFELSQIPLSMPKSCRTIRAQIIEHLQIASKTIKRRALGGRCSWSY